MGRLVPRLVIAGSATGVGKTTVTMALARALRACGLRVVVFKCGPDYLDPTYHARATDTECHNLDGWMMGKQAVRRTFLSESENADIALIEGVMGLFDGASATSNEGSTAEIAEWLGAPIILVTDASGVARSIAALVRGYADFDPLVAIVGVIANRVGSRGHLDLLRSAQRQPPIIGGFPTNEQDAFPERHLGLRAADEHVLPTAMLDRWGATAEKWCSLDVIIALARAAPELADVAPQSKRLPGPRRCRIGIARDAAFHFYYPDNLRRLESLGAELVGFSPLHDDAIPDVHGLFIGGGYPEVHAEALSANESLLRSIRRCAVNGLPIYAECGGLMYLTRAIRCLDGSSHNMVGLIDAEAHMRARLQAIGYVEVVTRVASILGASGMRLRGHQFRYSELITNNRDFDRIYQLRRGHGGVTQYEGIRVGSMVASYVHAHWASNPDIAEAFVASCESYHQGAITVTPYADVPGTGEAFGSGEGRY